MTLAVRGTLVSQMMSQITTVQSVAHSSPGDSSQGHSSQSLHSHPPAASRAPVNFGTSLRTTHGSSTSTAAPGPLSAPCPPAPGPRPPAPGPAAGPTPSISAAAESTRVLYVSGSETTLAAVPPAQPPSLPARPQTSPGQVRAGIPSPAQPSPPSARPGSAPAPLAPGPLPLVRPTPNLHKDLEPQPQHTSLWVCQTLAKVGDPQPHPHPSAPYYCTRQLAWDPPSEGPSPEGYCVTAQARARVLERESVRA